MGRLVIFDLVFFLLPFIAYVLWLMATRRTIGSASDWSLQVIAVLALLGVLVMVVAVVVFISLDSGQPGATYIPARVENGVVVPGHFE